MAANLGVLIIEKENRALVKDAVITLHPESVTNPAIKGATTGSDGKVEFLDIPGGNYVVVAAAADFDTIQKETNVVDFSDNALTIELPRVAQTIIAPPEGSTRIAPNITITPTGDTPVDDWFVPVIITVPPGATLIADNSGEQNLTFTTPTTLTLKRRDSKRIRISLSGFLDEDFTIPDQFIGKTMDVVVDLRATAPPPPPEPPSDEEPSWWQIIQNFLPANLILEFLTDFPFFRNAYIEIFGEEPTDENIRNLTTAVIDFIVPINTLSKLFTGKNLRGESEEFGSGEDWLDLMLSAAVFVPVGKVAAAGAKIGIGKISTAEAAKLTEQLGKQTIVNSLIRRIQTHPETSGAFLAKFPQPVREAVISGMYKTPAGRIAIVTLSKLGYFKSLRPFWQKALTNAGATTGIAGLLVGAIGSYPFAGFIKEEALQTLGFAVKTAKDNRDLEGMRRALDQQAEILDVTLWENFLAKIPYVNVVTQLRDFFSAAKTKLEIEENAFEELKKELEEEPLPPEEGIIIDPLGVFPTVTQVGNSITLTAKLRNAGEIDIPVNVDFVVVKPDGTTQIESRENILVSSFGDTDVQFILNTTDFPIGFYDVNIGVSLPETGSQLEPKNFPNAFQLTKKEDFELPPEEQVATLIIKGKPDDAIIEVANRPEITTQGTFTVPAGNYDVRASLEGFKTRQDKFFLGTGKERTFAFNLLPIDVEEPKGSITIKTIPSGAKIKVDGVFEFDVTPLTVFQEAGDHLVRMVEKDSLPKEETLTWEENVDKEETFILDPLPPEVLKTPARLFITSEPSFANVTIDAVNQFTTTPFTAFLDAGEHLIRVVSGDLPPAEQSIILQSGDRKNMFFRLTAFTPQPTANIITVQPSEIPPSDFSLLDSPEVELTPGEPISPTARKEILINIETTDLLPWKGRIFSIAYKDLSDINSEIVVLTNNDERALIEEFIRVFEAGDFKRIVGYNLAFDYRYLFSKIWLYRLQSVTLKEAKMRDVMQIMKQVKEEFVFGFQKNGRLEDWGKHLFGVGKCGKQETLLREYISSNFDYVEAFQRRQIELTLNIYDLARFSFGEGFIEQIETISPGGSSHTPEHIAEIKENAKTKECKTCLQVNPLDASECIVCGNKL